MGGDNYYWLVFSGLVLIAQSQGGDKDVYMLMLNAPAAHHSTTNALIPAHAPWLFFKAADGGEPADATVKGAAQWSSFDYANSAGKGFRADRYSIAGNASVEAGDGAVTVDLGKKVVNLSVKDQVAYSYAGASGKVTNFATGWFDLITAGIRLHGKAIRVTSGDLSVYGGAPVDYRFKPAGQNVEGDKVGNLAETVEVRIPWQDGTALRVGTATITPRKGARIHIHNLPEKALLGQADYDAWEPDHHFELFYNLMTVKSPKPIPHPQKPSATSKEADALRAKNRPVCALATATID